MRGIMSFQLFIHIILVPWRDPVSCVVSRQHVISATEVSLFVSVSPPVMSPSVSLCIPNCAILTTAICKLDRNIICNMYKYILWCVSPVMSSTSLSVGPRDTIPVHPRHAFAVESTRLYRVCLNYIIFHPTFGAELAKES